MALWDATSGLCTEAGQELASPGSSIATQPHSFLCHSLCSPNPHTTLVSRLEGVTIPVSPQPVQQSPRGATMVHTFLYALHVGLVPSRFCRG